mmetsp:Transcript_34559/g.114456  ORF Transcript_34559/g.114456 Transcript_34559/m.114456 type:complete len:242 (+) Transcript_34559:354-1079(+)
MGLCWQRLLAWSASICCASTYAWTCCSGHESALSVIMIPGVDGGREDSQVGVWQLPHDESDASRSRRLCTSLSLLAETAETDGSRAESSACPVPGLASAGGSASLWRSTRGGGARAASSARGASSMTRMSAVPPVTPSVAFRSTAAQRCRSSNSRRYRSNFPSRGGAVSLCLASSRGAPWPCAAISHRPLPLSARPSCRSRRFTSVEGLSVEDTASLAVCAVGSPPSEWSPGAGAASLGAA